MANLEDLEKRFQYHAPRGDQVQRYQKIRGLAFRLAKLIFESTPNSEERERAIDKIDEAVSWANAAIARKEDL